MALPSSSAPFGVPIAILTDSYKASHFAQYPAANKLVAYGEFRRGFEGDKKDTRFVFYGMRHVVETFLNYAWTEADVAIADQFYATHNVGGAFPFPKELFLKFIKENKGYFPIKVEALEEGTVANAHTPVYQITAEAEYAHLITFFETILTHVWYPTCVATLSRRAKEIIQVGFDKSVDPDSMGLIDSKLHDFGFRGCTSVEQAIIGGLAHLLNFVGSDTMPAAFYGQFKLNNGKPIAVSIPASEHSVMTSWRTETEAIQNMLDQFGGLGKVFSVVMDSYDYSNALNKVLPKIADAQRAKGGMMVLRPDSGDPISVVLEGLKAADKIFGSDVNAKGFKVLRNINVIQGDGININSIKQILDKVLAEGYSAQNVTYGMGGGLLQKVNRDTMSFATKLSYIQYADGTERDVMKKPKTDSDKISLPGILAVKAVNGIPTVFPAEMVKPEENLLKVVYNHGPVEGAFKDNFDTIRKRIDDQWNTIPASYDPVSAELRAKIKNWIQEFEKRFDQLYR